MIVYIAQPVCFFVAVWILHLCQLASKNGRKLWGERIQAKVKALHPNVLYVHCRSLALNLAISSVCTSVASIRNLFDRLNSLTWFSSASAKRKEIFLEIDTGTEDNELVDILTASEDENDEMSKSAAVIRKGAMFQSFVPLVGLLGLVPSLLCWPSIQ